MSGELGLSFQDFSGALDMTCIREIGDGISTRRIGEQHSRRTKKRD